MLTGNEILYFLCWLVGLLIVVGIPTIWICVEFTMWWTNQRSKPDWLGISLMFAFVCITIVPAVVVAIGLGTPVTGFKHSDNLALHAKSDTCLCPTPVEKRR